MSGRLLPPLIFLLVSCAAYAQPDKFSMIKHVIVIGVDGMSPVGIKHASTPHIDKLLAVGAHSFDAQAVLPTSSSPNWASMIMGTPPGLHGISSNDWELNDINKKSYCDNAKGEIWPTIFRVIRESRPEAVIACYHHWSGFGRLVEPKVCTRKKNVTGERKTAVSAARYIGKHTPLFTFVHLDHVDQAGHRYGYDALEYYKSISKADMFIGKIIIRLKEAGMYESTLILITSDHGGKGKQHGGSSPEERTIPWIVAGPYVRKGMSITQHINIYDTAVTVAYMLGLRPPDCWVGKPISSAFKE